MSELNHSDRERAERAILDQGWTRRRLERAREVIEAMDREPELSTWLDEQDVLRAALRANASSDKQREAREDAARVDRLIDAIERGSPSIRRDNASGGWIDPGRGWTGLALAIAACIGVAATVGLWWAVNALGPADGPGRVLADANEPSMEPELALSPAEVGDRLRDFALIDDTLGGRTQWVAFGPRDQTSVGLPRDARLGEPRALASKARVVAVVIRSDGDKEALGRADVVLRVGQSSRVTVPLSNGRWPATMHLTPTGDYRTDVMVELDLPEGRRVIGGHVEPGRARVVIGQVGGLTVELLQSAEAWTTTDRDPGEEAL
ncbi:MAG: hypothetical protein AAGB29_01260 [Planctomycetota bacterium]